MQDVLHTAGIQAGHILDLWRFTLALCTLVLRGRAAGLPVGGAARALV